MPAAAITELRRCAGTQFDPAVVDAFVAVLAERPEWSAGAELAHQR
jgi:HD-GYP domain-containing protein (c-di-GMP phosphodiesterase class II)